MTATRETAALRCLCRRGSFRPGRGRQQVPSCWLYPRKRKEKQGIVVCHDGPLQVDGTARRVIQARELVPRIMRYELTDHEWAAIKAMLPNKPRGVPRVNDRRVLNGIFWVLRSGAPWRDLPDNFGPYTTCYNRFVRWRRAGVWAKIMSALAGGHDAAVQMIDTSIVRVHQHGACITRNRRQSMGRSRGGLTSKIHAVVDTNGLPVRLALTAGEAHDNRLAERLLSRLKSGTTLLADRGYDADWIRALVWQHGALGEYPTKKKSDRVAMLQSVSLPGAQLGRAVLQ
jgi:transposase